MDRVGIKLWAKEKTRSNKWNIWKGFLAIFAASLGLSFIALLLFSVMIDIGGSSYYDTFTFMDLAVTVGVFALYFLVIGFSVNIYRYIKKIVQEETGIWCSGCWTYLCFRNIGICCSRNYFGIRVINDTLSFSKLS